MRPRQKVVLTLMCFFVVLIFVVTSSSTNPTQRPVSDPPQTNPPTDTTPPTKPPPPLRKLPDHLFTSPVNTNVPEIPKQCRELDNHVKLDPNNFPIRNPALEQYVPPGFSNPYKAISAPFVFGPCEEEEKRAIKQQLSMIKDKRVVCDEDSGHCKCPDKLLFDGEKCEPMSTWENMIEKLKTKWEEIPTVKENYLYSCMFRSEIPGLSSQMRTAELDTLSDKQLANLWNSLAADDTFTMFYASTFRGKTVLDIGSGFARQTLKFAFYGADVWFYDVSPSNLKLIRRIAEIYKISDNVHTNHFESIDSLRQNLKQHGKMFDAITAFGSMHHAPSEIIHQEIQALTDHLKIGGKWLQLAYPHSMWDFYKYSLFTRFGAFTDVGDGETPPTPWAEWYHTKKLLSVMKPARFHENWCGLVTFEFIWFDLTYLGKD